MIRDPVRCAALAWLALAALVASTAGLWAGEPSIIGTWKIVEAKPAPWSRPEDRAALQVQGKHLLDLVVSFKSTAVQSKF